MVIPYEESYFTRMPYSPYQDFPAHDKRADKLIAMTNPKSVLDVGCAYGFIVKRLLDKGIDAWGCDVSNWCEKQAQQIIPGRFVRCPADNLPFPDKRFDVLYCEGVMEHIPEEQAIKALSEFERVSHKRILQISFVEHKDSQSEPGHVLLRSADWWFQRIPLHTWLFLSPSGTDGGCFWAYKA